MVAQEGQQTFIPDLPNANTTVAPTRRERDCSNWLRTGSELQAHLRAACNVQINFIRTRKVLCFVIIITSVTNPLLFYCNIFLFYYSPIIITTI